VPVDNFYEWAKTATGKQPYAVALKGGGLMALAGLWESWRSPAGERVRSFAIITTEPNELCTALHNRDARGTEAPGLAAMARRAAGRRGASEIAAGPYPSAGLTCWPVSARVGSVKNNDPSLIEPIVLP
jgi:putative SOS response-associated peptidase YedK